MSRLSVKTPVAAPAAFTLAFLRTYFEAGAHRLRDQETNLRVPLRALLGNLSIDSPIDAEVRYVDGHGAPSVLDIAWAARATKALPHFRGALASIPDENGNCYLTLSGTYVPPGGVAGRAFDAIVGNRIARASLGDFVRRLARAAERDYRVRAAM